MKRTAREASGWQSTDMSEGSAPAAAIAGPRIYPGWLVVAAAFCGVMVSFGGLLVFTFGIFLKPLSNEFGWSRESISTAFGIAAMTVAVCSPMLGRLLDRYGARRVVLACMTVFGLAFGSLSFLTPSLPHLYATFFVIGIVGNGTTQMGYSRAVASWFTDKRGLALALVVAALPQGRHQLPQCRQVARTERGHRRSGRRLEYAAGQIQLQQNRHTPTLDPHKSPAPVRQGRAGAGECD